MKKKYYKIAVVLVVSTVNPFLILIHEYSWIFMIIEPSSKVFVFTDAGNILSISYLT